MNKRVKGSVIFIFFLLVTVLYFLSWYIVFDGNVISSDGEVYYQYFQDFILSKGEEIHQIKFPVGTTLFQLPFLLVALVISKLTGIDIDNGYAKIFQTAVFSAALFWFVIGIVLLYQTLRRKFSDIAATLSCFCITFGTMIPVYVCENASMSHVYGFFVSCLFFNFITSYEERYNDYSRRRKFLADISLGLILGLAFLIRNTNVLIGAVYLFYNVDSLKSLWNRLKTSIIRPKIVVQIAAFAMPVLIQLCLWRKQTGRWLLFSYGDEEFTYWAKPHILDVLFSDAKGLLIFCPILFIALVAMILWRKENKEYRVAQWAIFIAVTYEIAAWWCWWLGNAYSERMYCDMLFIFAVPLASFFGNLNKQIELGKEKEESFIMKIVPVFLYVSAIALVGLSMVWIIGSRNATINVNFASWNELKHQLFNILYR